MKKIGMIAAMLVESEKVVAWLGKSEKTDLYGDFCVKKFVKNDCEIYFINSGVGEILATASTQLLISVYHVDVIVNFGLAGSLGEFDLSQMCVVTHVVHYDFDTSKLDGIEVGRYERFDSPLVPTDERLVKIAMKANPEIKKVVCASGDKFVAGSDEKLRLSQTFGAQICEMESAGVLLCCIANEVPALLIKVISDAKDNAEEFKTFVERNNFDFVKILNALTMELA